MSARAWVVVLVAAAAIVGFIVLGGEDRMASGRGREGTEERSAQALLAAPSGTGAGVTISITAANEVIPADVKSSLEQVQQLIAAADDAPPEQARQSLQEAQDVLNDAIDSIEDAAADTSNDATRVRLLAIAHQLRRIENVIELRIDQL
jgi:hypothetical protein